MAVIGQEEQLRELQDRFRYLTAISLVALGLIVVRLVYLQILQGDTMRQYSEENRIKRVKITAPRGMIFDRNRKLIVDNRPSFDLEITPQYLRESGREQEVVAKLAELLKVPEKEIVDALQKGKATQPTFMPIKVKQDMSRDEVALIESWRMDLPGVAVQTEIQRTNVFGDIASHLIGYIGSVNSAELASLQRKTPKYDLGDAIGKFGIEAEMEENLRGINGAEIVEVDALGRRVREFQQGRMLNSFSQEEAVPGRNLVLTIDQDLQLAAAHAFGDRVGGLVAIDPRNGEILAMISRPSFDPTHFSRGIPPELWNELLKNEDHPLRDKTLQDHYSPGSTFKTFTAIAGLEEGVITPQTRFRCTGSLQFGNRQYHCWKKGGHGELNLIEAIQHSCDVYFYRVAQKLQSVNQLATWARHFGLGQKTGIPLAREVPGLIPTEEWKMKRFGKPWNPGESLSVAIGQSFVLATVLQLANAYATIANGGTLYQPTYIKSIESADGKVLKTFTPVIKDKVVLKPETIDAVRQGLYRVVNEPGGTVYAYRIPGLDVAGKTGTVQVVRIAAENLYKNCRDMKRKYRHHAWFTAFAPADDPKIAVAILAEHECAGSSAASPIAAHVIKTYLQKYFPEKYGDEALKARGFPIVNAAGILPQVPPPADSQEDATPEPASGGTE